MGEHVQESSKGPAGWQRRWGGDGRGVDTGVTIRFQPFSLWSTRPTLQRKYVQYYPGSLVPIFIFFLFCRAKPWNFIFIYFG